MNIIKCILLFFILLSCSNLSNRDKIDSKIYFKSVEGNKLDIDIELKFIPLETIDNNLIGNISQIAIYKDKIFVLDRFYSKRLYAFKTDGTYIGQIGNQGNGPGEYVMPSHFCFQNEDQIVVQDLHKNVLLFYDVNTFNYVKKKYIPFNFNICSVIDNNNIVWYNSNGFEDEAPKSYILATDSILNKKGEYYKADFKSGYILSLGDNLYTYNNQVYVYHSLKPYVYNVQSSAANLAYEIDFETHRFPPLSYLKEKASKGANYTLELTESDYISAYAFYENKTAIWINYVANKIPYVGWYNKETKTAWELSFKDFTEKIGMQGLLGTVIGSTDEYFISSINSEALSRRYIDNNELRILCEKSRKEDNPILCLFKISPNCHRQNGDHTIMECTFKVANE